MSHPFYFDPASVWVIAPRGNSFDGRDGVKLLTPGAHVLTVDTTKGPGLIIFTDLDLAERFVRDSGFAGEAVTFDGPRSLLSFLTGKAAKAACLVFDQTYNLPNAKFVAVESAVEMVQRAIEDQHEPE